MFFPTRRGSFESRIPLWVSTVLLAAFATVACTRMPAEEALREALGSMQAAIDARDGRALQGWLADDFVGPDGLDRAGARQLARASFMRYRKVGLTLTPARIELLGDHATVRFEAAVTGGSGRMLPDAAQVYEVETGWRLEGGDWRMTSAHWSPKL